MKAFLIAGLSCVLPCALARAQTPVTALTFVTQVKLAVASGNLNLARAELRQFHDRKGASPEYIEALSWVGRGELAGHNPSAAEANAAQVRALCLAQLRSRKLDADASLPLALGTSIEVQAQAAAGAGRRDEAVLFLRAEETRWAGTSIQSRIRKNLNLLTLEGKPAPPLDVSGSVTGARPIPLAAYRGHPVLLFFWAHWCSDCKAEIAVIERMQKRFAPDGLVVVAPTQHYGYVAGGADASRAVETEYIRQVWRTFYAGLGAVATPLSERNFANYGVSTTPTLVLTDRAGIVRLYHPGALTEAQLTESIGKLVSK